MLAEFLIELKLHEEQDKITQIVTGSNGSVKLSTYDEYINASKGKVPSKEEKAKEDMEKVESSIGVHLAMTIGRQMVAHKDIIVQSIIQGDSQDVVVRTMCNMRLYPPLYFSMYTSSEAQSQERRVG